MKMKSFISHFLFFKNLISIDKLLGFYFSVYFLIHKIYIKIFFNKFKKHKTDYIDFAKKHLNVSAEWFFMHIPSWMIIFKKKLKIDFSKEYKILELGSFEGLSTVFFLKNFNNSIVYSVDSFTFDENNDLDTSQNFALFKKNTDSFKSRLRINILRTDDFFAQNLETFDIIYVDAFHRYDYLIKDAINSFKFLNKGGILIFDDFMWNRYVDINDYPAKAVIEFYNLYKRDLEILLINYQVIFRKK